MKRLSLLLVLLLSLTAFTGCNTGGDPLEVFSDVQDTFIIAQDTVIELKQADKINQDDYDNVVLPALEAGNLILDKYLAHVITAKKAGVPVSEVVIENLTADLRSVLARLRPYLLR